MKLLKILPLILIAIIIGLIVYSIIPSSNQEEPSKGIQGQAIRSLPNKSSTPQNTESKDSPRDETPPTSSSSTNSNSNSNSQLNQNNEEQNCHLLQIPYAIKNFNQTTSCSESNCETVCRLEIHNLDTETTSDFTLTIYLIRNQTFTETLAPKELKEITATDQHTEHDNPVCEYETIEVPRKEFC